MAPSDHTNQIYGDSETVYEEIGNVSWFWRVLAFFSSWIILAGFAALPTLYDQNPQLRANKTIIIILSVIALTAGFSSSALVLFACRNRAFQSEAVLIPCLSSSSLGLIIILASFAISSRYKWSLGAILGTVVALVSAVIYGGLLLYTRHTLRSRQSRGRTLDWQPLKGTTTLVGDDDTTTWADMSRSISTHDRSPFRSETTLARQQTPEPTASGSEHRSPASNLRRDLPAGTLYADYDNSPDVQLAASDKLSPEDEKTRQQMMKLLFQQTSEQWRRNPDSSTFKIELPEHMRQALQRGNNISRGQVQIMHKLAPPTNVFEQARDQTPATPGSVYDWRDGKMDDRLWPSPAKPKTAPSPNKPKNREDRRREIELGNLQNG